MDGRLLDRARARWPKDDVEYVRLAVTTLIALLLLPLVVWRLLVHPIDSAQQALGPLAR